MRPLFLGATLAVGLATSHATFGAETDLVTPNEPTADIQLAQSASGFQRWVKQFRATALANGVSARTYDRAFRGVKLNQRVVGLDRKQAEFQREIWDYLDTATSPKRVMNGQAKLKKHARVFSTLEKRYKVDAKVIAAIWGLESSYGENMGDINIVEALATLAYDGRREKFGRQQLLQALKIIERGDITPNRMNGSWAGAMGHTQFIPTSYQAYAQDYDGDGKRNVWEKDPADALASTANYLKQFGWQFRQPWAIEVQLPAGFNYGNASLKLKRPASRWTQLGIRTMSGAAVPNHGEAAILLPAGSKGPAFAVYKNFFVIKRYNNANSYAIAVGHLGDKLKGAGEFKREWPRGPGALKLPQKLELQERLNKLGYDIGEPDGIIGPNTIDAISAFQKSKGILPDGDPNEALLIMLRKARR